MIVCSCTSCCTTCGQCNPPKPAPVLRWEWHLGRFKSFSVGVRVGDIVPFAVDLGLWCLWVERASV